jgi:hypothetical protein
VRTASCEKLMLRAANRGLIVVHAGGTEVRTVKSARGASPTSACAWRRCALCSRAPSPPSLVREAGLAVLPEALRLTATPLIGGLFHPDPTPMPFRSCCLNTCCLRVVVSCLLARSRALLLAQLRAQGLIPHVVPAPSLDGCHRHNVAAVMHFEERRSALDL